MEKTTITESQLLEFMLITGKKLPTTPEEVEFVEKFTANQDTNDQNSPPPSIETFWQRFNEHRAKKQSPSFIESEIFECNSLMARAARSGHAISSEVESKMEKDRDDAFKKIKINRGKK